MKDENPFKQKLYHHTLPVSDELWGRIEAQLPADKKRFPFLFFALATIILASAIVLYLAFRPESKQDDKKFTPDKNLPTASPLSDASTANDLNHNAATLSNPLSTTTTTTLNQDVASSKNLSSGNLSSSTLSSTTENNIDGNAYPVSLKNS